jgi:tRNA modification GTPase
MTYVIPLTSRTLGAIAVLQLTGPAAADAVGALTARARTLPPGHFAHTKLTDPATGAILDDALLLRTAPDSYELHLHGGIAVTDAVLAALERAGAKRLSLEEARDRHLLAPDPLRNELLHTLPRTTTITGARLLANQLTAGLTAWTRRWEQWLAANPSSNDLWRLHSAAQWLLLRSAALDALLTPPRIAIVGPPNAGKSTLANALLGRLVAITSDLPGTTRDWVDAAARLVHAEVEVPVVLVDTAGIRETPDPLEQLSITRTHEQARQAAVLVLLLDATNLPSDDELTLLQAHPDLPTVLALNKTDALPPGTPLPARFPHAVPVSAKTHAGLPVLMQALLTHLDLAAVDLDEPFAFTARQRVLLEELALTTDVPSARTLLQAVALTGRHGEG